MKKEEIKTSKDLLDYIMSKYEEADYFSTHELECIRDGFEEWVDEYFDKYKETNFEGLDLLIIDFIIGDYKDYRSGREFCDRH